MQIAKYNELKGEVFHIKIRNNAKQLPEDIDTNEEIIKLIPEEFYIPRIRSWISVRSSKQSKKRRSRALSFVSHSR